MTETSTADARGSGHVRRDPPPHANALVRAVRALSLFISQILDELGKVVRPTRRELLTYTMVVIVFVSVVMMFVWGLDEVLTKLVFLVFAG